MDTRELSSASSERSQGVCGKRLDHRLAERLREEVGRRRPGDKLEAMSALAARYGTSINTLRMALAQMEAEGWVEIRAGSGCYVRRPPPASPSRHVAILTEYNVLLSASRADFYRHLMDELRLFLRAKGRSSRLYVGHLTSDRVETQTLTCAEFMEDLALGRIEGVLALAVLPLYHWTHEAHERGVPIVGMRGCADRFDVSVDPDVEGGIRQALDILARRGRRRPAFVGWGPAIETRFLAQAVDRGLDARREWVRGTMHPAHPGSGWAQVREIWAACATKPDAIVLADDVLFQDAIPALASLGVQIPDDLDLAVLANAGIPLSAPFPFTRLDCDLREMASVMASRLLDRMAGAAVSERQIWIPYRPAGDASEEPLEKTPLREGAVGTPIRGLAR